MPIGGWVTVQASASGHYNMEEYFSVTTNTTEVQTLRMYTVATLPAGWMEATFNWFGAVRDADFYTNYTNSNSSDMFVGYDSHELSLGEGLISYGIDQNSYGADGGESLTFNGTFPAAGIELVIYVRNQQM